jgi:hypothetical protein
MEFFSKIVELIKLPLLYVFAFFLTATCFIFLPDQILIDLGVKQIRDTYRSYIGIVFIVSFSIILVNIVALIYKVSKRKYRNYRNKRIAKKTLKDLSNAEKEILKQMLLNGTNSFQIDITDGIHTRLESHKIIYRAANVSKYGTLFAFCIQPWAIDYLRKNMHLLK